MNWIFIAELVTVFFICGGIVVLFFVVEDWVSTWAYERNVERIKKHFAKTDDEAKHLQTLFHNDPTKPPVPPPGRNVR
jgi:hypothetical protein